MYILEKMKHHKSMNLAFILGYQKEEQFNQAEKKGKIGQDTVKLKTEK
jgi:hypothetical protein